MSSPYLASARRRQDEVDTRRLTGEGKRAAGTRLTWRTVRRLPSPRSSPLPGFSFRIPKSKRTTNESVPNHAIATSWCDRRHGRMRHVLGSDPKNGRRTGESVPTNAQRLRAPRLDATLVRWRRARKSLRGSLRWITRVAMEPLAVMQAEHGELDRPIVGASRHRSA